MRALSLAWIALCAVLIAPASSLVADDWSFDGRIEAGATAELSSRVDAVVEKILFTGGERVEAGQAMIELDADDARLDVAAAEAAVLRAAAEVDLARQEADRAQELRRREVATPARLQTAAAALRRAEADLAGAEVDLSRAELALERTVIRAPIAGFAGPPETAVGAFLEAEAGPPLGRIASLDPAIVAYRVPYATRLAAMAASGAPSLEALFQRIEITIELPNGIFYPHASRPERAAATVDPDDGALTVRAPIANPDAVLRPGMALTVHSRLVDGGGEQ